MQLRRRRRVLQEHLLIREHILGSREGRQSALVETGQNQLLLARVSVAVADRKDTGNVGFKTGGIDHDLLAIKLKTPFSDRAHLRLQAEEDEEAVERNTAHNAVVTGHTDFRHHTVFLFETRHRAHDKLHLPVFAELLHLGHTGGSSAEAIAAMDQNDALRLADEIQRPVESGVTAAADHDVLASEEFRITHPIEELLVLELLNARNTHRTGIKRAHTGGDDHGLAVEAGAQIGFHMAQELGYMHIPEGTLISVDELNQYPPEQVVLVTTGSQGEPLSALSRMASCSHRQVRVGPGDFIIISANPIPGNEKSVTKIVNGLLLLGAEVIYESMYDVHVSGHACQEEQKLMLTLTKPKYFLPVHGEYKQLKKHALTAASLGIPTSNILIAENGSNVILSQDEMKLGEPVTAGAVMVDGLGVGDVGNVVLRDRKHLSEDGLVIIVATVDSKTGKVLAGPDLVSRGFVYVRENESLMDGAQSIVENALERCVDEHVRDWNSVKTRVREALSSYIYRRTKRSPMILPILMEV